MTNRENILRDIRFEKPDYIPMTFHINDACWNNYPQKFLFEQMEKHKLLFPDFKRPQARFVSNYPLTARKNEPFYDDWGCLWETSEDGIIGTVTKHPLSNWEPFSKYEAPNPDLCAAYV